MPKLQASGAFAQALDDNARSLNGAYWKVYFAGTTTQATTYSDALLTIANAWPVIGDAAGRLPDIYVAPGNYRIRVETAGGVLIAESDNNVVYGLDPGEVAKAKFKTVAILQADETMAYAAGGGASIIVATGDEIQAGGFRYSVLASGASDQTLANANGVKVKALPDAAGAVSIVQAGGVSGLDATAAYVAASAACGDGGTIYFPPGTWPLDYATVQANRKNVGAQWLSIIKPLTIETRAALTADSGAADAFVDNVSFKHLRFEAMTTPTFAEQKHLITLNGCSNWTFEDCQFSGWRGDAIYIGSSDTGGATERHNRNIHVLRCDFDGVNNENRQAISAIDVDGLWVADCTFANGTRSNMPGVIDLEPNANAFHIIRNVWITGNKFENCGGNVGTITVFMPSVVPLPSNIQVLNNSGRNLTGVSGSAFVSISTNRDVSAADIDMGVLVAGNDVRNSAGSPFRVFGTKGFRSEGNIYSDCDLSANVGFTDAIQSCRDVTVRDTFIRVGATVDSAIDVHTVRQMDMTGSAFNDCGNGVSPACAIQFKTGTSIGVKLNNIEIDSPTGKTVRAVVKDAGHTFTPATNQHFGCGWGSLLNAFEAHQSDRLFTGYTPVVEGTSTVGAGTYSKQYGRWRRIGNQVFFDLEIIQTGHTGTGQIEISLPFPAQGGGGDSDSAIAIALDGVATTGGQIGNVNPAATAGGVLGCIRCFHTATGTLTQTTVPSGAATYRAAGSYMAAQA